MAIPFGTSQPKEPLLFWRFNRGSRGALSMTANLAYMPARYERSFRAQSASASPTGKKLFQMWLQAASHARDNATDWRSLTKALIEELAIECQTPDWDGYKAKAISQGTKYQAQ